MFFPSLCFCFFRTKKHKKTGSAPAGPPEGGPWRLMYHGRHDVSRALRRLTGITTSHGDHDVFPIFMFFCVFRTKNKNKNGQRSRGPPEGGTMTYPRP